MTKIRGDYQTQIYMAWRPRIQVQDLSWKGFENFPSKQIIWSILKHEQKKAVNCLIEGRDVFAAMPTGYGLYGKRFRFQLFATAVMIKNVHEGQHSDW